MKTDIVIKNFTKIALVLICVYGLFLRAETFEKRDYNSDEMCHFNYAMSAGFEPFWQRLFYGAELTTFPGYYLTTVPFIKIFKFNKWGVALPNIISTLAGFLFLFLITRKLFKTPWAVLITFFMFAVHRELVYHALELRPYAILPTFGLILFYLSMEIISSTEKMKFWPGIGLALAFIFMINYHAYGILMFTVCTVFYFLRESADSSYRAVFHRVLSFYGPMCLVAVPIWFWYYSRTQTNPADTFQYIPNPMFHPVGFLARIIGNLLGNKINHIFMLGLLLAWKFVFKKEQIMYLLVLIILPIELILIMDVRASYWFIQRQFIWVIPYFILFVGGCWDYIFLSFLNPDKVK